MSIPFWRRPWLDGAKRFYDDADYSDLPRLCPECGEEYPDDGEMVCPECRAPQNEDAGIDQVTEDQLSPPIEDDQ